MEEKEILLKYRNLTKRGMLPLPYRDIKFEDKETNHELQKKKVFYSSRFSTRFMSFKFVERTFLL
jgi:hypothetical protein